MSTHPTCREPYRLLPTGQVVASEGLGPPRVLVPSRGPQAAPGLAGLMRWPPNPAASVSLLPAGIEPPMQ
jgi:hypothetical protein